ncbi:hypothetical protein NDU88_007752 [Pleurodeles waltl]|uniref:Uncharacterized protein n=1 Tax=Pleurodeles waltl TaxID=8319 RepID=A0AAV7QLT4_PLEWA|nr:hypothetical protein NDU88_007752 [Pleurodeles waltl]
MLGFDLFRRFGTRFRVVITDCGAGPRASGASLMGRLLPSPSTLLSSGSRFSLLCVDLSTPQSWATQPWRMRPCLSGFVSHSAHVSSLLARSGSKHSTGRPSRMLRYASYIRDTAEDILPPDTEQQTVRPPSWLTWPNNKDIHNEQ